MSDYLRGLTSFVPRLIVERANRGAALVSSPTEQSIMAGVLFADVAGFTALTEDLARRGAQGAEDLTRILNLYFGELIDIVIGHGGDIAKFAGDAVVALWPATDTADLAQAVRRIAECSLDLQTSLHAREVVPGRRLTMKLSIGAGPVLLRHVGGVFDRWEAMLSGDALGQVAVANQHAAPGDIVAARPAVARLAGAALGEARPDGCLRLLSLLGEALPPADPAPLQPKPEIAPALRAYLPGAIRARVDAGQSDWLGELRRVSVVFVTLDGFDVGTPLERAHAAFRALQIALYRFEGSINKISVDDKGASVLAVLGLPPLAHEDDAERAVRAALNIQSELEALGFGCGIGVTSGMAFCGVIGNARRREYTVMGDVVNLAARLMTAARQQPEQTGGILVDIASHRAASARLPFAALEPIKVKGKAEPQPVFRPLRRENEQPANRHGASRAVRLIGRARERAELAEWLRRRQTADTGGGALLLEADAGMGKSRLLQELAVNARETGILVLTGGGDPIETATPYRAFRQILAGLMPDAKDEGGEFSKAQPTWLLDRLPADAELLRYAPLLGELLGFDWPLNDELRGLSGRPKAQKLQATLVRLLDLLSRAQPILLMVKDAQWLDSASLAMLPLLARTSLQAGSHLHLLIAGRPLVAQAAMPDEWRALLAMPQLERMELGPMEQADLRRLAADRLGADDLPDEVARFIVERADGSPLLAEELAMALRDAGHIAVEQRRCRRIGSEPLENLPLQHSIEGLITSRIDRLAPDEQLTIKVASVVGRVFSAALLAQIHPFSSHREVMDRHCETLHRLELTPRMRGSSLLGGPETRLGGGEQFKFKSNLAKEVAYNLMLFSQRRELHQRMAEWLERNTDTEQPAIIALLAHHWERAAEDREPIADLAYKAVAHRARSARLALTANAERDAMAGFRRALDLLGRLPQSNQRDRVELGLLLELGAVLVNLTSWSSPEVRALYERASHLGASTGDRGILFRALRGEWQYRIGQSEYALAAARAEEMLRLAEAADDDSLRLEAYRAIGGSRFWIGDFAAARDNLQRALDLFDPKSHGDLVRQLGQDPDVAIRGILAWALMFLGESAAAHDHLAAAVARAESLRHPFSQVFAAGSGMWLGFFLNEPDIAERQARIARDMALERGFAYLAAAASVVHGWAMLQSDGLAELEETVERWEREGGGIGLPLFLLVRGRALLEAGRAAEALRWLEDDRLVQRAEVEAWYAAPRLFWLGQARLAHGDAAGAAQALQAARKLAQSQNAALVLSWLD